MRVCQDCKLEKPTNEFYIDRRGNRPFSLCKNCSIKNSRTCYMGSREKNLERLRRYYRTTRRYKQYGITKEQFELVDTGNCHICGWQYSTPNIDHNKGTGEFRGILCRQCNTGLGMFMDDPDVLQRAIDYLNDRGYYSQEGTDD